MSLEAPGLTCATCHGPLYPEQARRTDDGWKHTQEARGTCLNQRRVREGRESRAARAEDLEWMAETGETFSGAAKRLGISNSALDRWLRHNDRMDLHGTLLSRDPGACNGGRRAA